MLTIPVLADAPDKTIRERVRWEDLFGGDFNLVGSLRRNCLADYPMRNCIGCLPTLVISTKTVRTILPGSSHRRSCNFMKLPRTIKPAIYALIVVLALVALWLVWNAPTNFLNARVVYQGF